MGADFIQYLVADQTVVPPPCRPHHAERLVYMPHSYFVNVRTIWLNTYVFIWT
jgi:protein O-GlcNAc transferase